MIRRILILRLSILGLSVFWALTAVPALGDPTPAPSSTAAPAQGVPIPSIPKSIQNNPYGQAVEQAVEGYLKRQRDLARNGAHGTVTYYRGYEMQVYTDPLPFLPAHYRAVHLHRGTVINPRGITVQNGMIVDVAGRNQPDGSLNADIINVVQ